MIKDINADDFMDHAISMQCAKSDPHDSSWLCSDHQSKNRFDRYLMNPQYFDARTPEDII